MTTIFHVDTEVGWCTYKQMEIAMLVSDNVEAGVHHIGSIDSGIVFNEIPLDQLRCSNCSYRRLCMGRLRANAHRLFFYNMFLSIVG